jgi:quinol monooxygenase YgiN
MIIVGGTFEVEPDQREEFLASRHDGMRRSRAEPGCLEYTLSPDPLDPGRVMLFERWEDQESLDAHLSALRSGQSAPGIAPKSVSIKLYDVSGERSLS